MKWNENHLDNEDYSKISGIKLLEIRLLEIKSCNDCDLSKYSKLSDSDFSGENYVFILQWHSALCHAAKCWWWLAVLLVSVAFMFPSKIWCDFDIGEVDSDPIPIGSTMVLLMSNCLYEVQLMTPMVLLCLVMMRYLKCFSFSCSFGQWNHYYCLSVPLVLLLLLVLLWASDLYICE